MVKGSDGRSLLVLAKLSANSLTWAAMNAGLSMISATLEEANLEHHAAPTMPLTESSSTVQRNLDATQELAHPPA